MNLKKLIIGGIVGGIVYFLLGWLVYGIILVDFMKSHPGTATGVDRIDMDMMYLVIGNLVGGFLLTYIFLRAKVSSLSDGFITAGVVGVLMSTTFDTIMYATTNIVSKRMMLADVIAAGIVAGIAGAIIGFVLGKLNKAT